MASSGRSRSSTPTRSPSSSSSPSPGGSSDTSAGLIARQASQSSNRGEPPTIAPRTAVPARLQSILRQIATRRHRRHRRRALAGWASPDDAAKRKSQRDRAARRGGAQDSAGDVLLHRRTQRPTDRLGVFGNR